MKRLILPIVFFLLFAPAHAANIYPDPGFEVSGTSTIARSGQRAAHLKVDAPQHWAALGGPLNVEPFARYRVTCWARWKVTQGAAYAPYVYAWDSYEWTFQSLAPLTGEQTEWTRQEVTFISPDPQIQFHPLAMLDAGFSEAWVDDVVIEQVATPQQTMAAIEANPQRTEDDIRLLARWYIRHNRLTDAARLLPSAHGLLRADLATILALAHHRPADRMRFAIEAVAAGAPTYHQGVERFMQMTRGLTPAQQIDALLQGFTRNPQDERTRRGVELVLQTWTRRPSEPMSIADQRLQLQRSDRLLGAAVIRHAASEAARQLLQTARSQLHEQLEQLTQEQARLGACCVMIGGTAVSPDSHVIALPQSPSDIERYAARELQVHLERTTGRSLAIVPESQVGRRQALYVGRCTSAPGGSGRYADEELRVRTIGQSLTLQGGGRGVLYAVYDFLERQLGCRWFTPDCSTWPTNGTIHVGRIDHRYRPALEYRGGDYPVAHDGAFAARLRLNGANHNIAPHQGGKVGVHALAHTFLSLCPPERYFATHPEYFSLVNGQRQSGYAQLCLTNPDVLKIVVEGVRRWIAEHPEMRVFSVSQNDTFNYCECPNCTAVAAEEGSQAGPMVRFVNAVADAIAKDHPEIAIETLAYQYTRKPPVTKPRPNVIICLCSIECCFAHPLATCPANESFTADIKGWNQLTNRLWIWDYVINYAHSICPFPNLYSIKPNIRFFIGNGVKGIYEESCYYTRGSELQELRNYILAKTLWDPSCETETLIREFCSAYYGPAAPFIQRYIQLIHDDARNHPERHVMIYTHPKDYITPDLLARADSLFDAAERAVQSDPIRLHRVQVARLPVLYAQIVLAQSGSWTETGNSLIRAQGVDTGQLLDRFERIARKEGVTMVREGGPDAALDAWLQSIPRQPAEAPLVTLRSETQQADVLPALGGRIWRLQDRHTGRHWLLTARTAEGWDPLSHGYEEYSETGYRSPGWREAYRIIHQTEREVVLEADLSNSLRITRRIALDDDALHIESTLTNTGAEPRSACLRTHPAFRVSPFTGVQVEALQADGSRRTIPLTASAAGEQELWLQGDEAPAGEWALVSADGSRLTISFPADAVAKGLLNWSPASERANLELFTPERSLGPGEQLRLTQTWETAAVISRGQVTAPEGARSAPLPVTLKSSLPAGTSVGVGGQQVQVV